ncbi:MAG: class I SAM-dependent methyltransferase [Bryobacteraceae bacterium]
MGKTVVSRPEVENQALSVKRAQVEFHNFASLGEPDRAMAAYLEENVRRGALIRNHLDFIGPLSPFLEIGANVGHTSYMMANEFGAGGFALDISADALRHGVVLQDKWGFTNAPVRVAGDAVNLPFADGSLRLVLTFQTLSQFMDLDRVFTEVKRVLAPGGVFLFAEEPIKRLLSMRLYRCAYYDTMKPWERKLHDWGLLGYIVQDVIGANQEESFGIRQNHTMYLNDWDALIRRHFAARELDLFVPERGWGERVMKRIGTRLDPYHSVWRAARLLGGTLAAACRKEGEARATSFDLSRFEQYLRCPDCHGRVHRNELDTLICDVCDYRSANEGSVYNLLRSTDKSELYPGDRDDVIDFSLPSHAAKLRGGWYDVEGVYGNKFRWMGNRAAAVLKPVHPGPQRLRLRGHTQDLSFSQGKPATIEILANGVRAGQWTLDRVGLFVLEPDLPPADEYLIEILASPEWTVATDERTFTYNFSMIRLVPRES